MLLFAASQICVAFLGALKYYNIYDVTPVMDITFPYVILGAKVALVLGVLGIIYVMIHISIKKQSE
jgi:hypothetical protein